MAFDNDCDFLSGADFDAVFDLIEDDLLVQDKAIDLELDEDVLEVCCSCILCVISPTRPKTDATVLRDNNMSSA